MLAVDSSWHIEIKFGQNVQLSSEHQHADAWEHLESALGVFVEKLDLVGLCADTQSVQHDILSSVLDHIGFGPFPDNCLYRFCIQHLTVLC